ncbi:MAG: cyanophycin synthetase [Anaerolineae bacterium]
MRIEETHVYCGPSPYGRRPVIRLTVDMGYLARMRVNELDGFAERLLQVIPALESGHLVVAEPLAWPRPPDFHEQLTDQLRTGVPLIQILPQAALALQCLTGTPVSFGQVIQLGSGRYYVVYEYQEEQVGLRAGRLAVEILQSALPEEFQPAGGVTVDLEMELESLARLADETALDPSTAAIVDVAAQRGIPHIRLNGDDLVQLGYGRRQQRIEGTTTSMTGWIAVDIAADKYMTSILLRDAGIPVPASEVVRSGDEAVAAAERLGYPVVTKPINVSHGRGLSRSLKTADEVRSGFESAQRYHDQVMVESFVPGRDHRILVVNNEVVAVAERIPGHVVGDGEHTIAELVDITNRDPRRGVGHEKVLNRIEIDYQAERLLARAGHSRDTVLAAGQVFYLRSTGDVAVGGMAVDRTAEIHYDNTVLARQAAKVVGLDIAGIDMITSDISRSVREVGGAVVEVNAAPDFRIHVAPSEGTPRDVATPVIDMLFPPGQPASIPIAAITGTNGKTTTARMVAHILKMAGHHVGLATSDGVYVDGEQHLRGDMTGPWSARLILKDPTVEAAVLETSLQSVVEAGLGFDQCDVAVVLNIQNDHLGMKPARLDSLDDIARMKTVLVDVVQPDGYIVLNADDPRCVQMLERSPATPIFFTIHSANPVVQKHLSYGGRAVVLEAGVNGQMVTLYDGERQIPLLWTHLIPATLEGTAAFNVSNALGAVATCIAFGVSIENIRQGLRTFATTFFQTPGRLNLFDQYEFRVLVDSAHNPPAYRALVDFVEKLTARRKVGVIGAPGNHRDKDLREMGRLAVAAFDRLVIREGELADGRSPGDVAGLLRAGALAAGMSEDRISIVLSEGEAVENALAHCHKDDLLVIIVQDAISVWKQIVYFGRSRGRPPAGVPELEILEGGRTRRLIGPRPGPPRIEPHHETSIPNTPRD